MTLNLMTAYKIAHFLKREHDKDHMYGWRPGLEAKPFSKRRLRQLLNRLDDLDETIEQMASLGLISQDGKGERGAARNVKLSGIGNDFLTNFTAQLEFVYRINPQLWEEFLLKVSNSSNSGNYDMDPTWELSRILQKYIDTPIGDQDLAQEPAESDAETAHKPLGADIKF